MKKSKMGTVKKELIEKACLEFEEAITQLGLDYKINDDVMEAYCGKFRKAMECLL